MGSMHFEEKVTAAFDFLISEYGFKCVRSEPFFVQFESDRVFAQFAFDGRKSYEVEFGVGLIHVVGQKQPYYLREILVLADAPEKKDYSFLQASTMERLSPLISTLVDLVKKYAKPFLLGDKASYDSIDLMRQEECDRLELESIMRRIMPQAEQAWREKSYHQYVSLLSPFEVNLPQHEKLKLKYARRHMHSSSKLPS